MGLITSKKRERRVETRRPIALNVYLSWPGQRFSRFFATDLSTRGVFVQMPPKGLARGMAMTIVFVLDHGRIVRVTRLRAVVARVCQSGVGLMLYKLPSAGLRPRSGG